MDWLKASAAEQGRAILAGLLSPVEQTEAYLDAAARHNYSDRIFARLTTTRARAEAIAAHDRAKAGLRRGLLDGVAISWKDNIDSAGIATEAGSRLLAGRVPAGDARILANATLQGMVCLGKTHMTELAFSGLGLNPMTATPPNSIDPALVPGGSSSGAAVSVALGLAAAAVGSDTGGSIRVPAAWNGLVGFKPTQGTISDEGVVPLCRRFDVAGPLARTVEDCAEIDAVLRGDKTPDLTGADPRRLRLLVLDGVPFEDAREGPVAAFQDAVDRLARAGARIGHIAPPCVAEAMALAPTLFAPEAYGLWQDQIEDAPELMYPPILERFRGGGDIRAADYIAGWERLSRIRADWARLVAGHDAVILPTSPILPPDAARLLADPAYFARENLLTLRNTRIGNLLGLPVISLPTGHPACGIMLMGTAGRDRALLVAASAAEAALR
ncbi:MAG: amidase family protein [Paracoccus sp. (in: a-proteobacteria)]|uniref:amidase n=1 Tax=Paracoccus sp. TaxID=267 RepID=UPI0039E27FF3